VKVTYRAYAPLFKAVAAWAEGKIGFLTIIGSGGSGKSRAAKTAAAGNAVVIEGQMSALGLYEQVYRAQGKPILIDDVDAMYADPVKVSILKCLCQTEQEKRITWHTASKYLESKGIPKEFVSTSSVCVVANDWKILSRSVGAIWDRGLAIEFAPTAHEVHEQVGKWFKDTEIYLHIGQLLDLIAVPSMRSYVVCQELKAFESDWKEALRETFEIDPQFCVLLDVFADKSLATITAKEEAFISRTGTSRATFYRLRRKIKGEKV